MRPIYVLDTCILSEGSKLHPNPSVLERMERYQDILAMPSICWHELIFGIERLEGGKKKETLTRYLMEVLAPYVPIIPYDDHAAWVHGHFRSKLESSGITLAFADSQIAATAIAHNMILVTRNVEDFTSITELKIENWFDV